MKIMRRIITIVLFLVIFCAMFIRISDIMRPKEGGKDSDLIHSFYSVEKNSLDVLFFGSSLTYSGIQPNVLWHEYGIPAYCVSSPSQSFPCSYYLIQEALRYQKPKVIVLDSYAIWNDKKYYNTARLHSAADPMKMGIPKLKMLLDLTSDLSFDEKTEYFLPFLLYHGRYAELTRNDFSPKSYLKGSAIRTKVFENEPVATPDEYQPVADIPITYFHKIVDLCSENEIPLVVVQLPIGTYEGDDWPTFTHDLLAMDNTFFDMLDQEGIPYIRYQESAELDLDWKADFTDRTHLNADGAVKVSKDIGAYLRDHYRLPDHRGEDRYASWEDDYEMYLAALND